MYKAFNDAAAKIMTGSGWIFIPAVLAIAGMAVAPALAGAAAVTNGSILTSFYAPFFATPATGATGISAGFSNIFNGVAALGTSVFDVTASGVIAALDPNIGVIDAVAGAWNSPSSAPALLGA
jgi:hypothetical protein